MMDRAAHIQEHGLDIDGRAIYLFGRDEYMYGSEEALKAEPGVEYSMANQFIKNLHILESMSDDEITVHMKTCGGIWEEGMAIYDAIKASPCFISIINYTHARSMSSIIFQAADERIMMPHSVFMIHLGTVSLEGTGTQFHTEYEQQCKTEQAMLDIYVNALRKTGDFTDMDPEWIERWLRDRMKEREDFYLSAKGAVDIGFADKIY